MTDSYDPSVSVNPFPQDIGRKKDSKSFSQEPLMVVDHEDPDKHLIGETLAPSSIEQIQSSGSDTSTGTSPFVARADHRHDTQSSWIVGLSSAPKTCPPGQTFLNNLVVTQGGVGWAGLAGNQIITFPREGHYIVNLNLYVERDTGGNFTNQAEVRYWLFNGSYQRISWRDPMAGASVAVPGRAVNMTEFFSSATGGTPNNAQFSYNHNDAVNHLVHVQYFYISRLGRYNYEI